MKHFILKTERLKPSTHNNVLIFSNKLADKLSRKNQQRDLTNDSFEVNYHKYVIGKFAEYAVCACLLFSGITCTLPDLKMYNNGDTGVDVRCTGQTGVYNIHVKSHTTNSEKIFGNAWLFGADEELVNNPKDNDIIVLTKEGKNLEIEILKVVKAKDVKYEHVFNSKGEWNPYKSKLSLTNLEEVPDFEII